MPDLVGNPKDRFSHDVAHIRVLWPIMFNFTQTEPSQSTGEAKRGDPPEEEIRCVFDDIW